MAIPNIPNNQIKSRNTIEQREHQDDAAARRVLNVDADGNPITADNRLPVDIGGAQVVVEGDVSVNLEAVNDLVNPDNVMVVGTEDGTKSGARNVAKIDSSKRLHVTDELAKAVLDAIEARLATVQDQTDNVESLINATNTILSTTVSDLLNDLKTNTQDVENILSLTIADILGDILNSINALSQSSDGLVVGTENGQVTGVQHVFVNNVRSMILAAHDRSQNILYNDFGTKNQRIVQVDYTAPSIGSGAGFTARKTITYTLIGNRYRRDNISWSLV